MKYTSEQYSNMVKSVVSYIMEAEHHNWRIMRRLEHEQELLMMHDRLEKVLKEATELAIELEDRLD